MPKRIEIPGLGIKEFPDSMSDEDISKEASRLFNESQNKTTSNQGVLGPGVETASQLNNNPPPIDIDTRPVLEKENESKLLKQKIRDTLKSDVASFIDPSDRFLKDSIDIDTGAPAGLRAILSFSKKNLADILSGNSKQTKDDFIKELNNKVKKKYPKGGISIIPIGNPEREVDLRTSDQSKILEQVSGKVDRDRFVYVFKKNLEDKDEKFKLVDEHGATFRDVADFAGDVPQIAGAIGSSFLPGGAGKTFLNVLAGASAGDLTRKGINTLFSPETAKSTTGIGDFRGGFRNTLTDTFLRALPDAALFGGFKALEAPVNKLTGATLLSPERRAQIKRIMEAEKEGAKFENLFFNQAHESKIAERMVNQAIFLSPFGQKRLMKQGEGLARLLAEMKPKEAIGTTGEKILQTAQGIFNKERNKIVNDATIAPKTKRIFKVMKGDLPGNASASFQRQSLESGATSLQEAGKNTIKNLKSQEKKAFEKVASVAEKENPVFDSTLIKKSAEDVSKFGIEPTGEVAKVLQEVKNLGKNPSFTEIKELRTRLIRQSDNDLQLATNNTGAVKTLIRSLTDTMLNPVNKNVTQGFLKSLNAARSISQRKFDLLKSQSFKQIFKTDSPKAIAEAHGQPGAIPGNILKEIKQNAPKEFNQYRSAVIENTILKGDGNAVKILKEWESYPDALKVMIDKGERKIIANAAKKMDTLANSNLGQLLKQDLKAKEVVKKIIDSEKSTSLDMARLAQQFGDKKEVLRNGIIQDFLDRSVIAGERGLKTVEKKKMLETINEFKKAGAWQLLTKSQQKRLEGAQAYLELITSRYGIDAGVSMEGNQIISNLQSKNFLGAAIQIKSKGIIAKMMSNDKINAIIRTAASGTKKPVKLKKLARIGIVLDSLLDSKSIKKKGTIENLEDKLREEPNKK